MPASICYIPGISFTNFFNKQPVLDRFFRLFGNFINDWEKISIFAIGNGSGNWFHGDSRNISL